MKNRKKLEELFSVLGKMDGHMKEDEVVASLQMSGSEFVARSGDAEARGKTPDEAYEKLRQILSDPTE